MFHLDIKSRLPIYEQLVKRFKELIINEVMKADDQLPSVRILANDTAINPNTIQKAYRELERQGYIYSLPGKGSFVAAVAIHKNKEKLEKLKEELSKMLSEAIYLGMSSKEIAEMIDEIESKIKGV